MTNMRKPRLVEFKVSFVLPEDATVAEARDYVEDAVSTLHGSLKPITAAELPDLSDYDPMSELDGDTVRVTRLQKRKP